MNAARMTMIALAACLAVGQSGCAIFGAVAGAALCGDSSECHQSMIETGAAVDVAIASTVVSAVVEAERQQEREDARAAELAASTAGGEEPSGPAGYYHCVDGDGHHVVELVAPSELEARYVCVTELGYPWSHPRAHELCSCRSRG